jgi:WD40 repeat protein
MEEVVQIEQTHAQDRDDADGGPEVSGRVMSEFRYHTDKVHACCADGETGMLYSASSDSTICCAPIKSGVPRPGRHAEEYVLRQHTDRVLAVVLTGGADGKVLLTGSADKTIRKWPLKPDGSPLRYNSVDGAYESDAVFEGHADWVSCLVVAEGSLFSGAWDSSIRKWDISTNRFIAELLGHQDPIYCLAAVGEVLLSGSRDCCVRAWHTDTCECLRVYEGHTAVVSSIVAVDPIMYTASWDKTIRKWDLAKGTCRIFRCSGCTHQ